jgi:probable rRNA maturation factor
MATTRRARAVQRDDTSRRRRLLVTVTAPDGVQTSSRGLGPWLSRAAPAAARGEVTVALVSDARMRTLNRSFRGKDYATDVLSFPSDEKESLGDIVIATGVAHRQADDTGHPVGTELKVLALHGLLHLLGYDHETDAGAMGRLEATLRKKAGLSEGLIARRSR